MTETLTRIIADLAGRVDGPFAFRFVMQPAMAAIYAILDGLTDARERKPPYLRTILTCPDQRSELLREGGRRVARVMALGTVMDVLYQFIVFKTFHPLQLVVLVLGLAFVPYVLLRGPITRIARHWEGSKLRA
jgi:hypothetical protein